MPTPLWLAPAILPSALRSQNESSCVPEVHQVVTSSRKPSLIPVPHTQVGGLTCMDPKCPALTCILSFLTRWNHLEQSDLGLTRDAFHPSQSLAHSRCSVKTCCECTGGWMEGLVGGLVDAWVGR
jgi:hypothetical protein